MVPPPLWVVAVLAALLAFPTQAAQDRQNAKTTNWPSLRFHFALKRSSMKVLGHSEFSMSATPVLSASNSEVLYDVFAQFTGDTARYNYSEVGGKAYLSTSSTTRNLPSSVACIDSESWTIPPINSFISGINEAVAVSSVSGSTGDVIHCTPGNLFMVSVNGINFALCASSSSGFKLYGSDMDVSVEYAKTAVEVEEPKPSADTRTRCAVTGVSSLVTSIGKSLLTGSSIPSGDNRKLKADFDFSLEGSCSCKSKPRPCVFVHGLGIKKEDAQNRDRFYYWGDLKGHAPCCSSIKYTYLNTSGNPWTSEALQQKVCDRATAVSKTSSKVTISDTIVVTHSMGNLMLAGAIANGTCKLDPSSTWVGIAGPMKGSMCSDFVQDSCAGNRGFLLEAFAEVTGKCPPTTGLKSLPYQGGNYSSPALDVAYTAAQKAYRQNVFAVMCSKSYYGQVSLYQSIFWVLGKSVPHKSKRNDGMVEFDSCAGGFPESKFGDTYRDRFYKTRLNHFDMEFLGGDAPLDESKMPVKWFECLL